MRRFIPSAMLAGIVAATAPPVFAQDQDAGAVSEAQAVSLNTGTLKDESVGIKPQIGILTFQDQTAHQTSRGAIGLAFDLNFSKILSGVAQSMYFGISTGGLYSHLGSAGSNFFGSSPNASGSTNGANLALFPANVKIGYNVADNFRVSAHGGGNVIYNSQPSTINWGSATSRNWNILPNVGGDVDIGLGKSVALTLRPDWTFTPNVGFFTGTLEFGFAIG